MEKALQVTDWGARPPVLHPAWRPGALAPILSCASLDMHLAAADTGLDLPPLHLCRTGTVVEGGCLLAGAGARLELACGDSFLAPAGPGFSLRAGPTAVVITTIR